MTDPHCRIGRITEKASNVVWLPWARVVTVNDVLFAAACAGLTDVLVLGYTPDSELFCACTNENPAEQVYMLELAIAEVVRD